MFIDRILVTLNAYKITPLLVFNKIDLYDEKLTLIENNYKSIYDKIGIKSISVSIIKNKNIDSLYKFLKNKTTLITGHLWCWKDVLN